MPPFNQTLDQKTVPTSRHTLLRRQTRADLVGSDMSESGSEDDKHSMWSRPFTFGGRQVRVEEGWGVGIGGTVWEGGVLLAQYLSLLQ